MKKIDVPLLVTVILCLTPLLFVITGKGPKKRGMAGGEYVILTTGEQTGDRFVVEKLSGAGIKGVISESSQWFFINDFSGLKRVPLDQFSDFLIETDPRNDGYAQKLRMVFVRDGRRYFYIPRRAFLSSDPSVIAQRVSYALGDTPHENVVFNTRPASNGLIFAAASLFSLAFAFYVSRPFSFRRRPPALPLLIAALLPASALFAGLGPAGLALAAIMLAFFLTLRPPLKSFFTRPRPKRGGDFSASTLTYIKRLLSGEKKKLAALFVLFAAVCITGGLDALYVLRAVLFFCLSAAVSVRRETASRAGPGHIRFFPVDIKQGANINRRLMLTALPFTLASAAALAITLAARPATAPDMSVKYGVPVISASDYEAHINFQKTFALRKLPRAGMEDGPYIRFEATPGGLLAPITGGGPTEAMEGAGTTGIPPFPLEKLVTFLGEKETAVFIPPVFDARGMAAVIIGLALYIPYFAVSPRSYRKKNKNRLYITERVSA
jgi:hypothetical protein